MRIRFIFRRLFRGTVDPELTAELRSAVREFESRLNGSGYYNRRKYLFWRERYSHIGKNRMLILRRYVSALIRQNEESSLLRAFFRYYSRGKKIIDRYNDIFVSKEISRASDLFDNIETYPLDEIQREAAVRDEDNNLIVAGAGTGKTTTIVGKYVYLTQRRKVHPENILLLAFTEKAAAEMRIRVQDRVKAVLEKEIDVNARTFHSLGLEIISQVRGYKPDILFDSEIRLRSFFMDVYEELVQNERFRGVLANYLIEYLKPYRAPETFRTRGEYIAYLRSNNILSLKREELKSFEEVHIANYLFLNNIEYLYEQPYEHETRGRQHRRYRPDFFLPAYGIYIEHWGVSKDGSVPGWFGSRGTQSATDVYQSKMKWAREIHKRHGTKLLEMYSYEKRDGVLLKNLERKLKLAGVRIERKSDAEILRHYQDAREIPMLINLIITFLNLYKSNAYTYDEVIGRSDKDQRGRTAAFIELFDPFYRRYEDELRRNDAVDFNDMIAAAADHVRRNEYVHRFSYVLIDEFQDISGGRMRLGQALLGQSEDTKLFCVGDDWQSIYRFTGADVSIMTNFQKHFGYTQTVILDRTYRYNDKILRISSDFIQRNPAQIKKKLKSGRAAGENPVEILFTERKREDELIAILCGTLDRAASELREKRSVFIISRYNFNRPSNIDELRSACTHLEIEALTAHKSKGLEADYVIIKSVVSGIVGFPCGISDDPLVTSILSEPETFENAEERRLFYVALTRARHKIFILSTDSRPSPFIRELDPRCVKNEMCPRCADGWLVRRNSRHGAFTGCSNYPHCRYTRPPGSSVTGEATGSSAGSP
jgi:DNA helicase IV